jgi:hypothetical protein
MDSYKFSKTAEQDSDSESEWTSDSESDCDSEWEGDSEPDTDSETESEYATDEELDEYVAPKTATGQAEPVLTDILEKINGLTCKYYRSILEEFYPVCKWFKNNDDKIATFFFPEGQKYDITDFKQAYLIRKIVDHTGPKQELVRAFLDTCNDVTPLGMQRVKRGSTIYYRILVGKLSSDKDEY